MPEQTNTRKNERLNGTEFAAGRWPFYRCSQVSQSVNTAGQDSRTLSHVCRPGRVDGMGWVSGFLSRDEKKNLLLESHDYYDEAREFDPHFPADYDASAFQHYDAIASQQKSHSKPLIPFIVIISCPLRLVLNDVL